MAQVYLPERADTFIIRRRFDWLNDLLSVLVIALFAYLGVYQLLPPSPVGADAPPANFSSARAIKHLEIIAQQPHPLGSQEHEKVRDYLLSELRALNLDPQVQQATVVKRRGNASVIGASVENIVARMKGRGSGKAVMLTSHYDSAMSSLGASDDGAGVAAMLETARALKSGAPLNKDVIFLFTDGEELGLLGAKAFVDEHPWAKDVGVVLNFEARGHSGPSIMFETSQRNDGLIKELAQAAPFPVASSMSGELYKRLPNDTDLTVFKEAGLAGLNFAFINGSTHYHTRLDNLANLNESSLQHQGTYALAMTRQLGELNGEVPQRGDAVYFNLFSWLVNYSQAWILPLLIVSILLFAGVVVVGLRRKHLSRRGLLWGASLFLVAAVAAVLVNVVVWWILHALHDRLGVLALGDIYQQHLYVGSFIALTIATFSATYLLLRQKANASNLAMGALFWWLILSAAVSFLLPGGSYLLTWPLLFSLLGLGVVFLTEGPDAHTMRRRILLVAVAVPALLLLPPMIYLLYVSMGLRAYVVLTVLVLLLLGTLVPFLHRLTSKKGWVLPAMATVAALVFIVTGSLQAGFDGQHPQSDHIFYGLNADTQKAFWASADARPDKWTTQFLSQNPKSGSVDDFAPYRSDFMLAPAPVAPLAAPEVELLSDNESDNLRQLKLRVISPRHAPAVTLYLEPGTEVLNVSVGGKQVGSLKSSPVGEGRSDWSLRYFALPPEGVEVNLQVKSAGAVKVKVVDQSYSLPQGPNFTYADRPADIMPSAFTPLTDSSLVSKTYSF